MRISFKTELKLNNNQRTQLAKRKDTLNKLTTHLAKNHGQIVIEDLNVSGMMANHCLAKSIADLG
jgi:putative transposase